MKQDFSEWLKFESLLANWMSAFQTQDLAFKNGRQAIPGFPSSGFRADGLLTNNKILLALEVEVKQTHPDTNVGKYWLLSRHYQYERVILLHVYTPAYNSYGWRKTLGEFYAEKMERDFAFKYIVIDLRKETSLEHCFQLVTIELQKQIETLFKA